MHLVRVLAAPCVLKKKNNKNNNSKQKFSIIVKTNVKASEIIDCTCAVNNENVEYSFAIFWLHAILGLDL